MDPTFTLYDIAFAQPRPQTSCAPNPWKARYALNFKQIPHTTQWVQLPDIVNLRRSLGVPACRKFADGSDFYTLPLLQNTQTGEVVAGDSFDIACYLETRFPSAGAGDLFPSDVAAEGEEGEGKVRLDSYVLPSKWESLVPLSEIDGRVIAHKEYARFQANVDMAFSVHSQLMAHGMRVDPEVEDEVRREFVRRVGVSCWEDLGVYGEARGKLMASLREVLEGLADMFRRDATGPFLLGARPCYADIIVGGWLRMMSKALPESEWEEARGWYDGVFGKLHDALQERFGDVK